jgi:hypothetical protein
MVASVGYRQAGVVVLLTGSLLLGSGPLQARVGDLTPFFGAFVGVAEVEDPPTGEIHQRDMDIVIQPYHEDGFMIQWVNVTLVDGRRDLPGVQRHVQRVLFEPHEERDFYVEVAEDNPFREREETRPMRGDPVRWASLDGDRLHVYAFVVGEDGTYELQVYDRVLTEKGIDIEFQRIVDDVVLRRIAGTTARTAQ